MSVTTWNTAPDYDQWGVDSSWSCDDWIMWHKLLKDKFGANKANLMWNYAYAQSGTLSSNLDCRTTNSTFRKYVVDNELNPYANAGLLAPVLQGAGAIQDVAGGVFSGASSFFSGNTVKTILNLALIGGIVFSGLYIYKNIKK